MNGLKPRMLLSILAIAAGASSVHAGIVIRQLDCCLYYGGAPESQADLCKLRSLGVRHVLDIRSFKCREGRVERRQAHCLGMQYQRIPTGFRPTRKNPDTTARILTILAKKPLGPIYFHCNMGSDRAGMLVALYRVRHQGWTACDAFRAWKSNQFNPKLKDLDRYYWQHVHAR